LASRIGTWFLLTAKIDPWSYENLLLVKQAIGARSEAATLRYILGRSRALIGKRRKVGPVGEKRAAARGQPAETGAPAVPAPRANAEYQSPARGAPDSTASGDSPDSAF
jgi:hypothetical protein